MSSRPILEKKRTPSVDPIEELRAALLENAGQIGSLVSDIWRLRRDPCRLTLEEYFTYRLHLDGHSDQEKQRFLGKQAQDRILRTCTDVRWWATAHDKALFSTILATTDLPTVEPVAVYAPGRSVPGTRELGAVEDVGAFLREEARFPLFGKPVDGMYSEGVVSLENYHGEDDTFETLHGDAIRLEDLLEELRLLGDRGYLFQRRVENHAELREIAGPTLATVRYIVLLTESGLHASSATLKLPGPGNVADNFWREGSILCGVDLESGTLQRAVSGIGHGQQTHERVPGSGSRLIGWSIPFWSEIRSTVHAAVPLFAGIGMQAWDVAVTDQGPRLLELNVGGDFLLPQLAHGEGLLDEAFRSFLVTRGYPGLSD